MGSRGTNEIIASVVRRSDNNVAIRQRAERALKHGRRQVWTVAVKRDDVPMAGAREVHEHRGKARRKAVTDLRHNGHSATRRVGHIFHVGRRAHNRNFHVGE